MSSPHASSAPSARPSGSWAGWASAPRSWSSRRPCSRACSRPSAAIASSPWPPSAGPSHATCRIGSGRPCGPPAPSSGRAPARRPTRSPPGPTVSDDLAADDVAYAVIPPVRAITVLLVSPGNLFLEKELSTDPQVKLEVRKPDAYQGGMETFDVVVLDGVSPTKLGPGRFVLVNTAPPDVPIEVLGRIETHVIMDRDRKHPIMRQVDFAKIAIQDAMRVRPLAAGKILV